MTIKIILGGPRGHMGKEAINMIKNSPEFSLIGCLVRTKDNESAIKEVYDLVGDHTIKIYDEAETCFKKEQPDVYIDLTIAEAGFNNTKIALLNNVRAVVGTSGLSEAQIAELSSISSQHKIGCIIAPNFALGSILMMIFSRMAAKFFPDVEIIEKHHDGKIDAPSGTAIKTVDMIKEARKQKKQGHPDEYEVVQGARGADIDGIKIHSMRLPGLVAHQEVVFGSTSQLLAIQHDTFDRVAYMDGLKLAINEVLKQEKLIYGLEHVMDLI